MNMKIAIIGAGNMGGAIARGLASGNRVKASDITVSNPSRGKLEALLREYPDINVTSDNVAAAAGADLVMLAVKPWLAESVLKEIALKPSQILVSVVAGMDFEQLKAYVGHDMTLFRIVPNTAIQEKESLTLIAAHNATEAQTTALKTLFDEMGLSLIVPEEKLAAGTAMASCGIAYVLEYVRAAMRAGIELGLKPDEAMTMVAQSCRGAAALLLNNGTHPATEIEKVCTPGGYTIRGINALEKGGFAAAIIDAMKACMY